ncbi:Uncharacterised protein [Mycobacteroides abscessus subsp. abscessus]|nr:Uncharacterised protein [Mycobacteroides abscessus subsp. abscessus]
MLGHIGEGVRAHVVVLGGFVEVGDEADRVVEHGQHVRERVAEEAADADGDVDARAAEFGERDHLEGGDAAAGLVPHRPHAQQREPHTDRPTERGYSP